MADAHTPSDNTVVSIEQWQRNRGGDDARFLGCPRCGGEEFAVVCRFASGRPFVAALLCLAHDEPVEIGVTNGVLADDH